MTYKPTVRNDILYMVEPLAAGVDIHELQVTVTTRIGGKAKGSGNSRDNELSGSCGHKRNATRRGGRAADRFPEFDGGTARVLHSRARRPTELRPPMDGSYSIKHELGTRSATARRKSR